MLGARPVHHNIAGSVVGRRFSVPDIQHAVQIEGTPETVYPLVATAKGFGQWWATDITESQGAVELGFFNRATVYRLRLKVARPPIDANWVCETGDEWNLTRIGFRLEGRASRHSYVSPMAVGGPRPTTSPPAIPPGVS
jgi:hypothetical protein